MEIHQYLLNLRERWRSGLVAALIVLLMVAGFTALQTPSYRATNQVFVQALPGEGVTDLNSGASFAAQQIASYAELATTPYVLDQVIDDVGLSTTPEQLARDIRVHVAEDSFIIRISASSTDPQVAAQIADSTAENLQEAVASLSPQSTSRSVELRVVAEAVVPAGPVSPDIPRNAMLGMVLALLVGVATALVRSLMNTRVRSVEDLRGTTERIVLGVIPGSRGTEDASRVLVESPYSVAAEAYRDLRTNLQFVKLVEGRRSVLVTSSQPAEGKSTVSVSLAHVMAMSGARVLLIDADLRSPSVHSILGLEGGAGLTTVLIGHAELCEVTQSGGIDGLDVITSGAIPPNPSELLGSPAMEALLDEASRSYDVVFVDAPPVLAVTDAAVLSQVVGGIVVVAQSERVRRAEFERAIAKLDAVDANVVGYVLNRVRGASGTQYAYGSPEAHAARQADAVTTDAVRADAVAADDRSAAVVGRAAVPGEERRGASPIGAEEEGAGVSGPHDSRLRGRRRAGRRPASMWRGESTDGEGRELERLSGSRGEQ